MYDLACLTHLVDEIHTRTLCQTPLKITLFGFLNKGGYYGIFKSNLPVEVYSASHRSI